MPRMRLGVTLLIPEPYASEINGLRRALGDPAFNRIAPHLTLVPPVNVSVESLDDALARLRRAASSIEGELTISIGPVATFTTESPVVMLPVGGDDVQRLHQLRDAVFVPPFERALAWSFVPHVTVAAEASPARVAGAIEAMAGYEITFSVDRLYVLRESEQRVWDPMVDMPFAVPRIVGRGGFEIELSVTRLLDPVGGLALVQVVPSRVDLVVTARHDGAVVGVTFGHMSGKQAVLSALIVDERQRGRGIGSHLLTSFIHEARIRGAGEIVTTCTSSFFDHRGFANGRRNVI